MEMYRKMLLSRLFDSKCMNLQRQGRIGFYVPCAGQEAAQVASAFAIEGRDWVYPTYRDLGVAFTRGASIKTLMAHLLGNAHDKMIGRQMPNHWGFKELNFMSVASPIATHLPVAVGTAMAMKLKNEDKIVLAYHGDGATSEGDFHAAYNFAGVYKVPIVFICENNGWAISVPVKKQTASSTLAIKASAYGFEGVTVDGNDVLAVFNATRKAVEKARKGGATMVECLTYRLGPHSTSDDPNRYRSKQELDEWKSRDCIARFESYLEEKGFWTADYGSKIKTELENELNRAIEEEEKESRPPAIDSMFRDVYAFEPWNLKEQRDEAEKE